MPAQLLEVALPVPLPRTFSYRHEPAQESARRRAAVGDLVVVPFGRRREVTGLVTGAGPLPDGVTAHEGVALRPVTRIHPPEYRIAGERLRLARWLAEYYMLPLGEVVPLFHPPAPGTAARGDAEDAAAYPDVDAGPVVLTVDQRAALAVAAAHLDRGAFGAVLLHGVTGSGKTEVYLALIERALAKGRSALYLLPEIALTPQTLSRIHARFGERAAAIHSGMSAGRRCQVHEAAARGELQVVVGPRSALFAPLPDLGVIVVDEEHESSYKQDEKPRYHARHAALVRGREAKAVVVLGSATPDLESVANARAGRFDLCRLPDRLGGGGLPPVRIVDMRGTGAPDGLSPVLEDALEQTLAAGRQGILYYNRRGFARALQCRDCGEVQECPNCDIALTYHLRPRRLLCHYCGHARGVPEHCPACTVGSFLPGGGGTEKIELHLHGRFPEARVLRLDHDTTRRRGSHRRILAAFAGGEADILVGTQMVAKGHHFPRVDLVGVLAADDGLGMPDFRSAERSFQLLTQVAGRAGRTGAGQVVFQTWRPEDPVIQAASRHDFDGFVAGEMPVREALGYPPARRLVRLMVSARRLGEAESAARELAGALRANLGRGRLEVLGPAPAVFPRLQDRFRVQLLLKGTLRTAERAWLADCLRALKESRRGVEVGHDVDPVNVY
ncbi:MAG: primosomal protein N' [Krumholzibacteria bacterium]|nr:primosomal protein N' [Candidatus Krumholzibacteria bacterium]